MQQIKTFLTLPTGTSKQAITLYTTIFPNSSILNEQTIAQGTPNEVYVADVRIANTSFTFMDMNKDQVPPLNWAISLLYTVESRKEFDTIFEELKKDGTVMMGPEPVEATGILLCCWVVDRFKVTWQLVLNK